MKLREMPPKLFWLTITMIIANTAGNMYYPLLPLYLKSLGATTQEIGTFFTLLIISGMSFRILGGWISDAIGRLRPIALAVRQGPLAISAPWRRLAGNG
ncbi:MAG: MFS transporter [Anaerolineae bacterium]|nr:MFS transporter [Anaerolineae bacterium]